MSDGPSPLLSLHLGHHAGLLLLGLTAFILTGCGDDDPTANDVEERVVVGVIDIDSSPGLGDPLQLPESARAGVPFQVTVTTIGSSTCIRPAGGTVDVQGSTAEIIPLDLVPAFGEDVICMSDLAPHPREVTVRFAVAGTATVRLLGRGLLAPAITSVEKQLTVQP